MLHLLQHRIGQAGQEGVAAEHQHGQAIGMGKAGLIGQKIVATLASTGTRSHFVHPGEAIHGDLGRVHHNDAMLMLSYSGGRRHSTGSIFTANSPGNPSNG